MSNTRPVLIDLCIGAVAVAAGAYMFAQGTAKQSVATSSPAPIAVPASPEAMPAEAIPEQTDTWSDAPKVEQIQ